MYLQTSIGDSVLFKWKWKLALKKNNEIVHWRLAKVLIESFGQAKEHERIGNQLSLIYPTANHWQVLKRVSSKEARGKTSLANLWETLWVEQGKDSETRRKQNGA